MSFLFPVREIPSSTSPSGDTYPAELVARETADIPYELEGPERSSVKRWVTRKVLNVFWNDIGYTCSSPFLQLMDRGGYADRARENRERIAREHAAEERRAMRGAE